MLKHPHPALKDMLLDRKLNHRTFSLSFDDIDTSNRPPQEKRENLRPQVMIASPFHQPVSVTHMPNIAQVRRAASPTCKLYVSGDIFFEKLITNRYK